jgi:tetratricopeptide (TPR) repeat protein
MPRPSHRFRTFALRLALVACLPVVSARPGFAVEHDLSQAEAIAVKAGALFKAGLFAKAADLYLQAFALSGRPLMVYNAARATEEAGRLDEARALFLHYLSLDGTPETTKAEARRRVAAIEARAPKQPVVVAPRPVTPEVAPVPKLPPPEPVLHPGEPVVHAQHPPEPTQKAPFPVGKTVTSAVLLAGALGTYLVARQNVADALAIDVQTEADKRRYLDLGNAAQLWRGAAVGLGVVGAGLAIWALVDGSRKVPPEAAWQVTPDGLGLRLARRW